MEPSSLKSGIRDISRQGRLEKLALRRLVPLIMLMMLMSYVDRANIAILGTPIINSIGLSATGFGFAVGLFFWGYLFFEVPSNIALLRFGSRRWLARIMISWGLVTGLTYFAQNEIQFAILRFLLGAAEAGLIPGILLFLTLWFPKSRQARPFSWYQISLPLSLIFSAVVTSVLLGLFNDLVGPQEGWRLVFAAEGALTVLIGLFILRVLPEKPTNARWLTPDDAQFMMDCVAAEQATTQDPYLALTHRQRIAKALANVKTWYLAIMYLAMTTGFWAITLWLPQIIADDFGTSPVQSGLISALPWVVALGAIILVSRSSRRMNERRWHIAVCLSVGAAGLGLSASTTNPVLSIIGLTLGIAGMQASLPLFYRYQTAVFTGVMTAVLLALVNSIGSFGGFIGPFIFGLSKDLLGGASPALWFMGGFLFLAAIMALFLEKVLGVSRLDDANADTEAELEEKIDAV